VHIRVAGLVLPVVIGIGVAVTSCSTQGTVKPAASPARSASGAAVSGSPTASPVASSSAGSVPAGYSRVGGAAQGISLAAPASWVTVNLAQETIQSAASKLDIHGLSATTLVQDMQTLQKLHAVFVIDIKSAVDSPQHVTPNLNAYCDDSGVTDVGAAAVPLIKTVAAAEFGKLGATNLTQKNLEIGGMPGVETSYQLSSGSAGTIDESQLEVLPKPDDACFVTVTGESEGNVVSVAAATAQFP
jgi:hypothetical protein